MGLDITAYSKIWPSEDQSPTQHDQETRKMFRAYQNPAFPNQGADIPFAFYDYDGETFAFCAGSYAGYSDWREELAFLADYLPTTASDERGKLTISYAETVFGGATGPFCELINFSDCEGCIGKTVSMKLAADFAEYQSKADKHHFRPFREAYAKWRRAFELAAQGGCVRFR